MSKNILSTERKLVGVMFDLKLDPYNAVYIERYNSTYEILNLRIALHQTVQIATENHLTPEEGCSKVNEIIMKMEQGAYLL